MDRTQIDKEHLYDAIFNDLLQNEHPNVICIPVSHKTDLDTTTYILFIVVNISMEGIPLEKEKCIVS